MRDGPPARLAEDDVCSPDATLCDLRKSMGNGLLLGFGHLLEEGCMDIDYRATPLRGSSGLHASGQSCRSRMTAAPLLTWCVFQRSRLGVRGVHRQLSDLIQVLVRKPVSADTNRRREVCTAKRRCDAGASDRFRATKLRLSRAVSVESSRQDVPLLGKPYRTNAGSSTSSLQGLALPPCLAQTLEVALQNVHISMRQGSLCRLFGSEIRY